MKELSFETTVSRHLVHRAAVSEVLVTDYYSETDGFFVAVQLPRTRYRTSHGGRYYDSHTLAEAFRQSVIVACHVRFQVPADHAFVMSTFEWTMHSGALTMGERPAELSVRLFALNASMRNGALDTLTVRAEFLDSAGSVVMVGSASARVLPAPVYRSIRRGTHRAAAGDVQSIRGSWSRPNPSRAGVESADLLVHLDRHDSTRYLLQVDRTDPQLFDHPVDHVPGMVIFEVVRQVARLHTGRATADFVAVRSSFTKFIEWNSACIATSRSQGNNVEVVFDQNGECARVRVELEVQRGHDDRNDTLEKAGPGFTSPSIQVADVSYQWSNANISTRRRLIPAASARE